MQIFSYSRNLRTAPFINLRSKLVQMRVDLTPNWSKNVLKAVTMNLFLRVLSGWTLEVCAALSIKRRK